MNQYTLEVANTIRQQLYGGGMSKVMSWGARGWACGETEKGNSFLAFRVSGFIFKGIVKVILWGNDTYTIQLVKREKGVDVVKKEIAGIYNDDLTDVIDGMVEKAGSQEEYEKKVQKAVYKF